MNLRVAIHYILFLTHGAADFSHMFVEKSIRNGGGAE